MEELLIHLNNVRPSIRFTVEVEKDGRPPFLTPCSRGGMMAAWTSPSTGNRRTQTGTWTSTPTIHPRTRGDCSSACFFFRTQPGIEPGYPSTLYPDHVIRNTISHVGSRISVVNEVLFIYHSLLTLHIYAIYKIYNMYIRYIQYILHVRYIIRI